MTDCIFCQLAGGDGPATYVHQDDRVVVIEDLHPVAPTHVLIIPREHFDTVRDVRDPALLGHLFAVAHRVADERGISQAGYRLVVNIGRDGGQTVNHLHLHLVGGRPMKWPPG